MYWKWLISVQFISEARGLLYKCVEGSLSVSVHLGLVVTNLSARAISHCHLVLANGWDSEICVSSPAQHMSSGEQGFSILKFVTSHWRVGDRSPCLHWDLHSYFREPECGMVHRTKAEIIELFPLSFSLLPIECVRRENLFMVQWKQTKRGLLSEGCREDGIGVSKVLLLIPGLEPHKKCFSEA